MGKERERPKGKGVGSVRRGWQATSLVVVVVGELGRRIWKGKGKGRKGKGEGVGSMRDRVSVLSE